MPRDSKRHVRVAPRRHRLGSSAAYFGQIVEWIGCPVTVTMMARAVIKADTGTIPEEAAKLTAYATFADGNFVVPKVLHCDFERDLMILERLEGYTPLQEVFLQSARRRDLALSVFHEAGVILAHLHCRSDVAEDWVRALIGDAARPSGQVLLHGDFGFSNVLFRHLGEPLALLDPCPPGTSASPVVVGMPIDDLALMFSCLIGRVPLTQMMKITSLPRVALMESMFSGYASIRPPGCDFHDALDSGTRLLKSYLTRRRMVPAVSVHALVTLLAHSL